MEDCDRDRPCVVAHTTDYLISIGDYWIKSANLRDVFAEQSVVFGFYDSVAFARSALERRSIKHRYGAANILNKAFFLQVPGRDRNTFAADTEHVRDEIVRHDQLIGSK